MGLDATGAPPIAGEILPPFCRSATSHFGSTACTLIEIQQNAKFLTIAGDLPVGSNLRSVRKKRKTRGTEVHRETRQIFAFHVSRSFNVLFPSCGPTDRNGIILGDRSAAGELQMSNQSVKNQQVTGFRLPVIYFARTMIKSRRSLRR
jgi:hypothetical protein